MGFGFRKSVNLGGGVRMNVGKKGIGFSAGTKGARISTGPRGTRARVSIPGTGIYYEQKLGASKNSSRRTTYNANQNIEIQKQQEKEIQLEQAKNEVKAYEEKIEYLISMHKECTETFDWENIIKSPPFKEGDIGPNQLEAINNLKSYKPSFRDKFFKRIEARKILLKEQIQYGIDEDKKLYKNWISLKQLAENVISGDIDSYKKVLEDLAPFNQLEDLGSDFEYQFLDSKSIVFNLYVHSDKVIPSEVLSLTKTGKLSRRKMTKTMFYELYQDYVASCVLRIARELFALLPLEKVYINAIGEEFDSSIGKEVNGTILSVKIDPMTLNKLDIERIDCSDSLVNFEHNMKFRKTKGFAFVDNLEV